MGVLHTISKLSSPLKYNKIAFSLKLIRVNKKKKKEKKKFKHSFCCLSSTNSGDPKSQKTFYVRWGERESNLD